tara:strand:- start:388 stop:567 length:180 start_codon:yes stop_codon:yes gene_type:complete
MKNNKFLKALQTHLDTEADKEAGYPPNCNEGYIEKDGECVPVEDTESYWKKKKKKSHKT